MDQQKAEVHNLHNPETCKGPDPVFIYISVKNRVFLNRIRMRHKVIRKVLISPNKNKSSRNVTEENEIPF